MKTIGTFHIVLLAVVCRLMRRRAINLTLADNTHRRITQVVKFVTLLLPILFFITETAWSQNITLNKKDAALEDVFFDITKQTGYNFKYKDSLIQKAKRVTVNLEKTSLIEALDLLSKQQPLLYSIDGKNVLVNILLVEVFQPKELPVVGRITDLNGNPLEGANISVSGTNLGTNADVDGNFKLTNVDPNSFLEISHVGYESQFVKLSKERNLQITMEPIIKALDEVVTNGYRTTTRRDNLGTSTKITAEEIARQPVNNILAAMQAKIPGMIVTQKGGLPGSPFAVQIRGQRSIGTSPNGQLPFNSPLFIIDGVPFLSSSETITKRGDNILANSPFSTINPADIESVEVLRDANATSIYGSLGANGVILITTKKAKPGTASISANVYAGFGKITRAIDYTNTEQYIQLREEAFKNDGEIPNATNAPDIFLWSRTRYTNWKKLLIGGSAQFTNAHVRFAGGSETTQFALSIGYNKETTVFPGDHGKSFSSASMNIEHKSPNKKLEISFSTSYGFDKSNLFSHDPTLAINTPPNAPGPYDSLGRLLFRENGHAYNNPLSYLFQPYRVMMERMTSGIKLNYKIKPWLNLRTNAGYNVVTGDETLQVPIQSLDPVSHPTGSAIFGNNKSRNWIIEPQIEYNDTISKGAIKALAGTSLRSRTAMSDIQNGLGYTTDAGLNSISNAVSVTATHDFNEYRVISAYALINYKWDNKYIIEGTIRRDGSSRFGPKRKFGTFSSLAAGWIFTNEAFMVHQLPAISFGKLRVSYGTTGNDQIDDYQFLDTWLAPRYPYQNPTLIPLRLANADYRWEKQKGIDIGMDLGLYKDKIMLSATWNQSRTNDQLVAITLPAQTGFIKVIKNFPAVTQNRNLEIELNTTNIQKGIFKWTTSINFTIQKNKLLKFPDIDSSDYGKHKFIIGQPLNLVWGVRSAGLDATTGVYRFLDKNNKAIDLANRLPSEDDYVKLGTYDPEYFGGFQNNIQYGNWQLHVLFQFVKQMGQHAIYSSDKVPGLEVNQSLEILNRWRQPGDNARYQQFTSNLGTTAAFSWGTAPISDLAFTDASFIRLKNVSVSYTLPRKWSNKLRIKNSEIYAQGQNLLTFTHFKENDPETYLNRESLPPLKIFALGIRASF